MNAAAKIGINNKLEIYDRQLVEDYVNLKTKLTVLTNQFLNYFLRHFINISFYTEILLNLFPFYLN